MAFSNSEITLPTCMYRINKVISVPEKIELPTCMYNLKSYQKNGSEDPSFNNMPLTVDESEECCDQNEVIILELRQEKLLNRLCDLKAKLEELKTEKFTDLNDHVSQPVLSYSFEDIVISCNPSSFPAYLLFFAKSCCESGFSCCIKSYIHSSVTKISSVVTKAFNHVWNCSGFALGAINISVHWKDVPQSTLMVSPLIQCVIYGDNNILRYLCRLLPNSKLHYESRHIKEVAEIDSLLDEIQDTLMKTKKEQIMFIKKMETRLNGKKYLLQEYSIADVCLWSFLYQLSLCKNIKAHEWISSMLNMGCLDSLNIDCSHNVHRQQFPQGEEGCKMLQQLLNDMHIQCNLKHHEEVFTVDNLMKNVLDMPGLHMKNLFLNDKKKSLYLLAVRHDCEVKLSEMARILGTRDLRFAEESVLYEVLGINQGCVTLFALVNDSNNKVQLVLDSQALNDSHPYVNFHPLTNSATLGISPSNLKKFLYFIKHEPVVVEIN